jgi:hypothetical protein
MNPSRSLSLNGDVLRQHAAWVVSSRGMRAYHQVRASLLWLFTR